VIAEKPKAVVIGPAPATLPSAVDVGTLTLNSTPTTAPAEAALIAVATEPSVDAMKLDAPPKTKSDVPPIPAVTIPTPPPELAAPAKHKVQMPTGTPEEQSRTLWGRAIDAEANQDYVEAVECYELIRTLPRDVQPWGLDVRLEQAKRLAK
jgi:hypothetical protein